MTFDEAMHLAENSVGDVKVCFDGAPFHIFDHDGCFYCFCPDGYSRPIDLEKEMTEAAKNVPWFVTDGLLDYNQAIIAATEYGGDIRRSSWDADRVLSGYYMVSVFGTYTEDDKAAKDWMVVPKNGVEIGQLCLRNGCIGIMQSRGDGDCSCHINAPCTRCPETAGIECDECGFQSRRS